MPQKQTEPDVSAAKAPSATSRALALLMVRSRSRTSLARLLQAEGYEGDAIDEALVQVQAWGYLHDGRLAQSVAHAAVRRGKGPAWAKAQLRQRELPQQEAAAAVAEVEAHAAQNIAQLMARRFAGKDVRHDRALQAKAYRFLLGRGFSMGQISDAWRRFGLPTGPSDDGATED